MVLLNGCVSKCLYFLGVEMELKFDAGLLPRPEGKCLALVPQLKPHLQRFGILRRLLLPVPGISTVRFKMG